jgi:hypothetical protein
MHIGRITGREAAQYSIKSTILGERITTMEITTYIYQFFVATEDFLSRRFTQIDTDYFASSDLCLPARIRG